MDGPGLSPYYSPAHTRADSRYLTLQTWEENDCNVYMVCSNVILSNVGLAK